MKATCRICGRRRPMMDTDQVCFPCSVGIFHNCPICRTIVSGSGQGPCYPCSQRHRSERQIAREAATIPHKWLADLFTDYCEGDLMAPEKKTATGRIARAAAACRRIAITVPNPDNLTTDALYAALGTNDLRRVSPLIRHMTDVRALKLDYARLYELIEDDRIATVLKAYQEGPHAGLLERYRDDFASRVRMPITPRTAVTAAVDLLAELGDAPLADLRNHHLRRTLRKSPEYRAALQRFLGFVAAHGGPILALPKPSRSEVAARKRWLLEEVAWRERLARPCDGHEAQALIAVLIARIHALPLSRVLTLRYEDVAVEPTSVTLWPDADALDLEESLADAFRMWIALKGYWTDPRGPYAFGNWEGDRLMSETTVARHLTDAAKRRARWRSWKPPR